MGWTAIDDDDAAKLPAIGCSAFAVYFVLAKHRDRAGKCWPSIRSIAAATGLSEPSVRKALSLLAGQGLITRTPRTDTRGGYTTPEYRLRPPPQNPGKESCPGVGKNLAQGGKETCPPPGQENSTLTRYTLEPHSKNQTGPLPPALDTPEFRDAWEEWIGYRRERKKPLTPSTIRRQLSTLAAWGATKAITAIHQAIERGWEGLFEPKDNNTHGTPNGRSKMGHANKGRVRKRDWSTAGTDPAQDAQP